MRRVLRHVARYSCNKPLDFCFPLLSAAGQIEVHPKARHVGVPRIALAKQPRQFATTMALSDDRIGNAIGSIKQDSGSLCNAL